MNHAITETALLEQLELQADIGGEGLFAATYEHRGDEQMELVDRPGRERVGGEIGTGYEQVTLPLRP